MKAVTIDLKIWRKVEEVKSSNTSHLQKLNMKILYVEDLKG